MWLDNLPSEAQVRAAQRDRGGTDMVNEERPLWQVACYDDDSGEAIGGENAREAVLAMGATRTEPVGDNDPACGLWLANLPWTNVIDAEVTVELESGRRVLIIVETP